MEDGTACEVLLHLPGVAAQKRSMKASTRIGDLLDEAGVSVDLLVFGVDDDADDDLEAAALSRERTVGDFSEGRVVVVHCHHCRQIQIKVNYKAETIHRKFPPSTRCRKVLRWAKRKLHLTDADADNLALFLCDTGNQVRESTHLGELVADNHCEVCFDLSKDRNIEGIAQ